MIRSAPSGNCCSTSPNEFCIQRRAALTAISMPAQKLSRFLLVIAAYVFVLVPVYSVVAALEGAVRCLWPLTVESLIDQGAAFLGQVLTFVLLPGIIAVPVLAWIVKRYIKRRDALGLLIATIVVMVVLVVTTAPFVSLMLLAFPAALAAASAVYAFILLRALHPNGIRAPAT